MYVLFYDFWVYLYNVVFLCCFVDEVVCVDLEECRKVCDNFVGCLNIVYFKLVLELLFYGKLMEIEYFLGNL